MRGEVEKGYNGWSNYETRCVALWIDNTEGAQREWDRRAQELLDSPGDPHGWLERGVFTRQQVATTELEDEIKASIEEMAPDLGASMFSDLLSAALSSVSWREIAEHYIDGKEPTDTAAEDAEEETPA